MSSRHPDDDPTGIRDLLAGLSDPEPPSEHLLERISASLNEVDQDYVRHFDPTLAPVERHHAPWGTRLAAAAAIGLFSVPLALSLLQHQATDTPAAPTAHLSVAPLTPTPHDRVTVVRTGAVYHRGSLARQATAVTPTTRPVDAHDGPVAASLDTCLADLSLHGTTIVDVARFERDPALIVVRDHGDGTRTVTVLSAECGHGHREPLAGPVLIR